MQNVGFILRTKTCKACKTKFSPQRPLQSVCSPVCALTLVRTQAERKERLESRKTIRLKKEQLKTRSEWMKEAQSAFNKFIRERDGKTQSCISCGSSLDRESVGGAFDCGHFRSVGSAPHLRFDERNAHGQCKRCNRYLSGNVTEYRTGLIKRIGIDNVLALESDNTPRKYTISDLKNIIQCYKLKIKELKK